MQYLFMSKTQLFSLPRPYELEAQLNFKVFEFSNFREIETMCEKAAPEQQKRFLGCRI